MLHTMRRVRVCLNRYTSVCTVVLRIAVVFRIVVGWFIRGLTQIITRGVGALARVMALIIGQDGK